MPKNIKIAIFVIVLLITSSLIQNCYQNSKTMFNQSKTLELEYVNIENSQIVTWDSYYLNFQEQNENVKLSKEGFIELTQIVMSSRKDGQNLAWKWVQENQNIPFEEFTHFYKQLSGFISQRFDENLAIENRKLDIVQQQNLLISTFPNNVYNWFLKIKPLNYKVGFISEQTKQKFNN
jgi:hypothetical protein